MIQNEVADIFLLQMVFHLPYCPSPKLKFFNCCPAPFPLVIFKELARLEWLISDEIISELLQAITFYLVQVDP